jgi:glycosyltransferase involved in cell wall biosynthesis
MSNIDKPHCSKLVVLLPSYFEDNKGGAELQTKFLIQSTITHQLNVYYIFLSNTVSFSNPLCISLNPIPKKQIYTKLNNIKYPYTFSLLKILNRIKPDLIYNRTGTALSGIAAYYSKKNKCRFVFHIASDKDVKSPPVLWGKPWLNPEYKFLQYGIKNANSIIAQTQFQAEQLGKNHNRSAVVIPNGHPVPADCQKVSSPISVLWIANCKPIKRPELFIRLTKELGESKNINFIMLGRTVGYEKLAIKAREIGIDVRGEVSDEKVRKILSQSHILVNTSKTEGFSNTFIEAWMHRVPVVSLNVDPDNILKENRLGFCSGDLKSLARDTTLLINDEDLRESMGDRARKYSIKHHSLLNMDKILKVLQ